MLIRQWQEQGYIVVPQLFDSHCTDKLQVICERIKQQWIQSKYGGIQKPTKKNLANLTAPQYFKEGYEDLVYLLGAIADKQILTILNSISDRHIIFNDAQYFFEPIGTSWCGDWHRDGQAIALSDSIEQERIATSSFIRVHLALVPENLLEIVPGSHSRWDTPEELAIRKSLHGKQSDEAIEGATTISLQKGDAVFFDGYSIHRGNYFANVPRKMLALLYGSAVDWFTPPRTCFDNSTILDLLPEEQRAFFYKLITAYEYRW